MGGGGSPKSRQKEQNQLLCDSDKGGEGVKKSLNFADVINESPLTERVWGLGRASFTVTECFLDKILCE